jgi:hypothetical protein
MAEPFDQLYVDQADARPLLPRGKERANVLAPDWTLGTGQGFTAKIVKEGHFCSLHAGNAWTPYSSCMKRNSSKIPRRL